MENWHKIPNEINNIKDKVSNKLNVEIIDNDLKGSLEKTIEDLKTLLNDVVVVVENTVKDAELKQDTTEIMSNIKTEFSDLLSIIQKNQNPDLYIYEEE